MPLPCVAFDPPDEWLGPFRTGLPNVHHFPISTSRPCGPPFVNPVIVFPKPYSQSFQLDSVSQKFSFFWGPFYKSFGLFHGYHCMPFWPFISPFFKKINNFRGIARRPFLCPIHRRHDLTVPQAARKLERVSTQSQRPHQTTRVSQKPKNQMIKR